MKKTKRKYKRGFTLIELLAVIIILGILMIIAVPSVTEYIQTSRRNSYIVTAKSFIDAATTKINSLEYELMDVEATYYLPTKCVSFEKGGESPFGEFQESYVVVTYDGTKYDYYYTGRDSSNHGIVLTYRELLDESFILANTKTLDLNVAVGSKKKIIKFTDECNKNSYEENVPMQRIEEHGTLRDGSIEIATNEDCFEFSDGKITNYICSEGHIVIPEYIRGEKVTTIGRHAFQFSNSYYYRYGGIPIYTITIPKTITTIEDFAIDSQYLYNIVNKTGRAFDWDKIISDNSEGDNYFETGTYYALEINDSAIHQFEITTERVNYDLTNIFEPAGGGKVKIKDKGIYKINVAEYDGYNNGWVLEEDFENGEVFNVDCQEKVFHIVDTNDNEIFISDLGYQCCE